MTDKSTQEDQVAIKQRRAKGEFVRGISGFRGVIGDPDFPAEPGRYHLYVALNCPWCHRVTLARNVLGLQNGITMDVAFPNRTDENDPDGPNLWEFAPKRTATLTGAPLPECTGETGTGKGLRLAKDIYQAEGSEEQSVPILYDKIAGRIVNNESAEIIRMFDAHADALGSNIATANRVQLLPTHDALKKDIHELNKLIYTTINNGAYKAGFSSDQSVYAAAFDAYFKTLEALDDRLSDGRSFLTGNQFTEADLRLFPTLYRHDPVYYLRMKLNGARVLDYPHLWRWLCRVYAMPGVAAAGSLVHCRQGYFGRSWNGVVPKGPRKPMPYPEAYLQPDLSNR
ncbi:MAG: glutathione S-transferase C-terminal domain-containing protein [Tateyamaria sp.]|uniref:glutathione S-transferase C-terminal domain-containing protein n=1 Tax=Tateyamaria sp. TaxID=1929288 RepID=UPI003287539B